MFDKKTFNYLNRISLGIAIFLGAELACQAMPITPMTPNIVIIYTDDLGIGDVSAYNAGKLSTPNIDSIAKQGALFTDFYGQQS